MYLRGANSMATSPVPPFLLKQNLSPKDIAKVTSLVMPTIDGFISESVKHSFTLALPIPPITAVMSSPSTPFVCNLYHSVVPPYRGYVSKKGDRRPLFCYPFRVLQEGD